MKTIKHFKKYLFLIALIGILAVTLGCSTESAIQPKVIAMSEILGVPAPVRDATPVSTIIDNDEYTGTVIWDPVDNPYGAEKVYTATITLTAKDGYTLTGVTKNFFTVAGATTVTNPINSGVVTAVFPETTAVGTGLDPVDLLTAADFVILAKTAISTTAATAITGDIGLSPAATSYITGFALSDKTGYAESTYVTGKVYASDMALDPPLKLTTAISNIEAAYTNAAGRQNPKSENVGSGEIGGLTLVPGLHKWTSAVTLNSNLTLTGGADDVWIFQINNTLTLADDTDVLLAGGATYNNVFWQVAEGATLGTNSHMEGIILSQTNIEMKTGSSINGRLLAQTAVTLDATTIVAPAIP